MTWAATLAACAAVAALILGHGAAPALPPLPRPRELAQAAAEAADRAQRADSIAARQHEAVAHVVEMAGRRWDDLRGTVHSDACRGEFEAGFAAATANFLTQTPFPEVPSQCPPVDAPDNATEPFASAADVRVCYFLLVHKSAAAVARLVDALDHPNHQFVVHVDAKADPALAEALGRDPRVTLVQPRVEVSWGGFSIVNATLLGMQAAAGLAEPWDFFVDLSESDYPIKSDQFIREHLAANRHTSYVVKWEPDSATRHASKVIVECDAQLNEAGRWVPGGLAVTKGSQWFVAERAFVDWVAAPDNAVVPALVAQARHWTIPDEGFFQTLHDHSPLCHRNVDESQWFLEFPPKHVKTCNNRTSTFCGRSPKTLQQEDLAAIQMSPRLFGRKFNSSDPAFEMQTAIDEMRGRGRPADDDDDRRRVRFESQRAPGRCIRSSGESALRLGACDGPEAEWELGPCSDGDISLTQPGGCLHSAGTERHPRARALCGVRSAAHPGRCLDLLAGKMEPGSRVGLWECTLDFNQMWRFDGDSCRVARMSYEIPAGLCIDFGDPAQATVARDYEVADGAEEPYVVWCNSTVVRHRFSAALL